MRLGLGGRLVGLGGGVYGRADALLSRAQGGSRAFVAALLCDSTTAAEKAALVAPRRRVARGTLDGFGGLAGWERAWLDHRLPPPPGRLLVGGGEAAVRVALALAGRGYYVDLIGHDGAAEAAIADALAAAHAREADAELATLVDDGERREGPRRGPPRRGSTRRNERDRRADPPPARASRGFGEWHEPDDLRARGGFRERGAELRGGDRRYAEERRAAERRHEALTRGDQTPLSLDAALEDLARAVLDGDAASPAAPLAERRYDAAVLLGGALGRVFDRRERERAVRALHHLIGRGPLLCTFERADDGAGPADPAVGTRGERVGRALGRALGRLRRIEAGGRDLVFAGAAGYRHAFADRELAELAAATGRTLEWDPEPGPPHATLATPPRRK